MTELSILILTKNGGEEFRTCLEQVYAQTVIRQAEVIVVDSGSTDGNVEFARSLGARVEQIAPQRFHHARTRNLAAGMARGEILVFLSQDAIPSSDEWLEAITASFKDPAVGAVYGKQLPKQGASLERKDVLDTVYGDQRIIKDPAHRNGLGYRFYHFSDVNSAIRRSVWQSTQFPEDLRVFEDLGIAKRILDAGWKIVYEPGACVFHSHHHTTIGLFKRYFDIGYTLKRLQIWDSPGTRSSLLRDGWMLLRNKLRQITRKRTQGGASALGQDIAKSAGLFLGLNQHRLPYAVKRHLSANNVCERITGN
jgi:rhamnosyltransferase